MTNSLPGFVKDLFGEPQTVNNGDGTYTHTFLLTQVGNGIKDVVITCKDA